MQEFLEHKIDLPGVSVLIGTSQWNAPQDWVCPESNFVVCQRISEGHSALRLDFASAGIRQVYSRVNALGFMPSTGTITMHPLGQPLRTLNCFFDRAYFEAATEIDAEEWLDFAGAFMPLANRQLEALMNRINAELVHPGFGSEQVIEAASTMVAVEMARLAKGKSAATARRSPALAAWQLRRIQERIEGALDSGYPGILELSELCGVSKSHLMRAFKAATGTSLHTFIARQRQMAARHLLAADQLSIKQIAASLGFCNPAHFSNAFHRDEQMSPTEFRMRARASNALKPVRH